MADSHAPNMAYKADVTANRLTTQREVSRTHKLHRKKLHRIANRKREFTVHEPKFSPNQPQAPAEARRSVPASLQHQEYVLTLEVLAPHCLAFELAQSVPMKSTEKTFGCSTRCPTSCVRGQH